MVYAASFILFFICTLFFGVTASYALTLPAYIVYWIGLIALLLLAAKWYFKRATPTLQQGLFLGCITIGVSLFLDGISILATYVAGESLDMFVTMYTSVAFYVTIFIVLVTCMYAGFEFDSTYTHSTTDTNHRVDNE